MINSKANQKKKSLIKIGLCLTLSLNILTNNFLHAGVDLNTVSNTNKVSLAPMLKQIVPSVVHIKIYNKQKYYQLLKEQANAHGYRTAPVAPEPGMVGMGSGVIINAKDGIIVTNNHVINNAEKIVVTLHDGRNATAKLIGSDPDTDLAVLKVNTDGLIEIKFADSDQADIGDFVVAIGSPFGFNQTVTSGIVSGKGRMIGLESYEDFIQTDASINPGNSGGALVNLKGELVGINTAILAPDGGSIGIGFAIPSNMAANILEQLLRFGKVRRGLLGVMAQTLTPELASAFGDPKQKGAIVGRITRDSIAYNSDLKVGDIIEYINNKKINNKEDLRNTVGLTPINQDMKLGVIRDGKKITFTIKMLDPTETKTRAQKIYPALAGAYMDPVKEVKIPHLGSVNGLKLLDVIGDSPAWQQGLRSDDIILSVNNKEVKNFDDLAKAVKDKNKPLLLQIARQDSNYFLALKPSA